MAGRDKKRVRIGGDFDEPDESSEYVADDPDQRTAKVPKHGTVELKPGNGVSLEKNTLESTI
jgi:hypothetical protein